MKKIFLALTITLLSLSIFQVFAEEEIINEEKKSDKQEVIYDENTSTKIMTDKEIQNHITEIGYKLLNASKVDVRMAFVYKGKSGKFKKDPSLSKRQIYIYDDTLTFAKNDAELAAYIARQICKTAESYNSIFNGKLSSIQVKSAPKKYEIFFDKRAIDFLVVAGYNPLALITFLHKSEPQRRFDKISAHNKISKRLAYIYEYIYMKYPSFLVNNEYLNDETYQHFLLSSIENRRKLYKKLSTRYKGKVDYE